MRDANQLIKNFHLFIDMSWKQAEKILRFNETAEVDRIFNDWLQANWEILIEASLFPNGSGFLEVYGEGADCYETSSRVFLPNALPTHEIFCKPASGNKVIDLLNEKEFDPEGMKFSMFVGWNGKVFSSYPPFDSVLFESENGLCLALIDKVAFDVRPKTE